MKLTLMIEGSPAVIAVVLAALPGGATVVSDEPELPYIQQFGRANRTIPETQRDEYEYENEYDGAPVPVDTGAPAFDSAGVRWDARIHAATKAIVADGTWRMKRGVDKAVVDAVMPELRTQMIDMPGVGIIADPEAQPMPVMPTAEAQPMPVMPGIGIIPDSALAPTPLNAMPLAPPVEAIVPAVTGVPITIPEFMQHLSVQMTGPDAKITNEYLAEVVGRFNATYGTTFVTVNDFFTAPDKLPALVQLITLDGRW